uniref:Uncharacterized protein n=1 Tax=Anguilla anguilla TaxID=7936 RepID=A0A0E9VDS8_ANGAN
MSHYFNSNLGIKSSLIQSIPVNWFYVL